MQHPMTDPAIRRVAMIGNHLPRRCGIATFTTDLTAALTAESSELDTFVVAMNDTGRRYDYPEHVRFALAENDFASYRRAADFLNVSTVDVACIQHEYGIFGGKAGAYLMSIVRELRMPVVTTLHTILAAPNDLHRDVMVELCELSERVVVMSSHGKGLLAASYGVSEEKIDVIPHGIPGAVAAPGSKYRLGVEDKSVILTFGLLSPDKGIEHMIDALADIVKLFPETVYIVLGATHPHVAERQGEAYRSSLESRARRREVDAHVLFHDRFVTPAELTEFLAAADIYVTPYVNMEQATSGTLAYAVGAGKAVISTPYAHARELLAENRGILIPCGDAPALARAVIDVLGNDTERAAMGARAAAHAAGMTWPNVARLYLESFSRARVDHAARRRTVYQAKTLAHRPAALPETNLSHVETLTDSTGMLQHAHFSIPRYEDGYCVDDNARALLLMALLEDAGTEAGDQVRALAARYLAFINYAFDCDQERFRNFMSYGRRWTETCGSEDSHGRALWALGAMVGRSRDPGKQSLSSVLFHRGLGKLSTFTSPRAWALGLLGIDEYLRAFQGDSTVETLRKVLAERLLDTLERTSTGEWPWFEEQVTYENARLAQALIASGAAMGLRGMKLAGLRALEWLISVQYLKDGYFAPIGSEGFYRKGGPRALYDQQPLEAWATVSACLEARRVTADARWMQHAHRAFGWFLGRNHLDNPLYDAATGGCRDALHADRPNENQGAESTLAFQLALVEMRSADLAPAVRLVRAEHA